MTRPKVATVLVNWNNHKDTIECLRSLGASSYSPAEVIVVENGSQAASATALREVASINLLIESPANLGFTGGNNLGIQAAVERGADFIFVLNNDTIVHRDTIGTLVVALEAMSGVGIATPKIRFFEPGNTIWYGGGTFSSWAQNPTMLGYKQVDDGRWDTPHDVAFASGCAMLIRREVIERLGGFDNDFFAVWEDVDLSLRVRNAGYRIAYVPLAVIWHKESAATGGQDSPAYVYYQTRNRLLFLWRWARSPVILASSCLFTAAYLAKRSIGFVLRGNWAAAAMLAAAVRDGLAKRTGPRVTRSKHPVRVKSSHRETR